MKSLSIAGRFANAMAAFRASPERPSTNLSDPDEWFVDWATGSRKSVAGVTVTNANALTNSAWYACIRILAETVAGLPPILYERTASDGRKRAIDHKLWPILHDEPNPLMSPYTFWETLVSHCVSHGNAYALIVRDKGGVVTALWPIPPDRIKPTVLPGTNALVYESDLLPERFAQPSDIFHVPGLAFDGLKGYNPVELAREAIGLTKAAELMASGLFGRGARPSGILTTDDHIDEDGAKRLKASWDSAQSGIDNQGKTAVLFGGLKYQALTINPKDAQFMDLRKFQTHEVARMFRMPLHMIGELDRATFSNIEHQGLSFVTQTLRPWLVRFEKEVGRKLLTVAERRTHYFEFLVDALLRGDIKTRFASYSVGIQTGFMTRNEARRFENWEPGGDELDEFLEPMNMEAPGGPKDADGDGVVEENAIKRQDLINAARALLSKVRDAGRDMTPAEDTEFETLSRQADDLLVEIGEVA
jgi:HK97 family phage portal protein